MVRIHFPPAKSLQTIGSALWELTRARVRAVSGQQKRAVPVWHEESGQRRRGKKSGIEPNRYGDPKSCDGLTGKQGSANEGRGPGTFQQDETGRRLEDVLAIGDPDMYSAGNPVQATTTTLKELQVFPQPLQKPHPRGDAAMAVSSYFRSIP